MLPSVEMRESYAHAGERFQTVPDLAGRARACRRCPAVVPGSAVVDLPSETRPVLFVGEAPGRRGAARTGRPFDGDTAAARFACLLAAAGLPRAEVALTNAVLCLPLDDRGRNRRPRAAEAAACLPFLTEVLDLVRPRVVAALGAVALAALGRIEPHRLTLKEHVAQPCPWRGVWLMPLYHPAARSAVHRPFRRQLADWRALGEVYRSLTAIANFR
ncbi:MAG: hypothetical protein KatS3mg062_1346 [Tepidiforma sp.]|nr:MAG: hypothetical protein KatS3mg062_1346 [Tepidiforma sp.]